MASNSYYKQKLLWHIYASQMWSMIRRIQSKELASARLRAAQEYEIGLLHQARAERELILRSHWIVAAGGANGGMVPVNGIDDRPQMGAGHEDGRADEIRDGMGGGGGGGDDVAGDNDDAADAVEDDMDDDDDEYDYDAIRAGNLNLGLIPPLGGLGRGYYYLSTFTHIFLFVFYTLFHDKILDESGSNYLLSCVAPRFLMTEFLEQKLTVLMGWQLSAFIVGWRYLIMRARKDIQFDAFRFMLVDEDVLENVRIAVKFGAPFVDDKRLIRSHRFDGLRDNLHYKVESTNEFILRPNRTGQVYRKFKQILETTMLIELIVVAALVALLFGRGLETMLARPQQVYRGCAPTKPSDLAYWYQLLGTTTVSLIYLFDSFCIIFFVTVIGFYVTYDLLIYWLSIKKELSELIRELPMLRAILDNYSTRRLLSERVSQLNHHHHHQAHLKSNESWGYLERLRANSLGHSSSRHLLELKVSRVQASLLDFFKQLRRADHFVNLMLSFGLTLWLVMNATLTLTGVQTNTNISLASQVTVRVIQFASFLLTISMCWYVLKLKRAVESTYVILCSLMALDPSASKMIQWDKILSYFIEKPAYAFTYFNNRVFSRLSYMKIISFTITSVFVIESLQFMRATRATIYFEPEQA